MGLASALSTALTGLSPRNHGRRGRQQHCQREHDWFQTIVGRVHNRISANLELGHGSQRRQRRHESRAGRLGTQVASITPDFSQGTIQTSSSPTDLAIQGNGFFIVQGSSGNTLYTRNGQFTLNSANQLVNTTGQLLLGNGVNSNYQISSTTLQPVTIPIGGTSVAQATQNVYLQGDSVQPTRWPTRRRSSTRKP